ncbi:hypothetical protein EMCRGX_G024129 [Ephydatia muelleri]
MPRTTSAVRANTQKKSNTGAASTSAAATVPKAPSVGRRQKQPTPRRVKPGEGSLRTADQRTRSDKISAWGNVPVAEVGHRVHARGSRSVPCVSPVRR